MAGEVSTEDMDVWTFAYFCDHFLLGRRLVANQTDNEILRVLRDLLEEFKLDQT